MENLFKNDGDYIGVFLTPTEASLISKVLFNLRIKHRKDFLSPKEEDIYQDLYESFRK